MARRGRSFQGDMKKIVKKARYLQSKFLKEQGLTMSQARKLSPSGKEELQRIYKQWYDVQSNPSSILKKLRKGIRGHIKLSHGRLIIKT